jgi:hypothetical protein
MTRQALFLAPPLKFLQLEITKGFVETCSVFGGAREESRASSTARDACPIIIKIAQETIFGG